MCFLKWVRRSRGCCYCPSRLAPGALQSSPLTWTQHLAMCTCVYATRASPLIGRAVLWRSHCIIPPIELVWFLAAGTRETTHSSSRWPTFPGKKTCLVHVGAGWKCVYRHGAFRSRGTRSFSCSFWPLFQGISLEKYVEITSLTVKLNVTFHVGWPTVHESLWITPIQLNWLLSFWTNFSFSFVSQILN